MNAEPQTIWDSIIQIAAADRAALIALFIIVATLIIVVIAVIASKTVYRMHKNRLEDALKRELIERGFSADEIATIVESSAAPKNPQPEVRGCATPKENKHVHV
jgi:hypothetical protein